MARIGRNQTHALTTEQRFMENVRFDSNTGCWLWTASRLPTGYGEFGVGAKVWRAHRWAYEHWNKPVPKGFVLDHLCREPSCVNPRHLEAVTQRENVLRGNAPAARQARQTACIRGHEFSNENTYRKPNGARQCKQCRRQTDRQRRSSAARADQPSTSRVPETESQE